MAKYQSVSIGEMDEARHKPIILSALRYGYLSKFTSPLHHYLIENGKIKDNLKKQYRQDLKETWLINDQPVLRRHQLLKIFLGKLTELQIAEYLEEQGWHITNLEALCCDTDIETTSPIGDKFSIEIKFIGLDDDIFLHTMEECGSNINQYDGANYLLFRSYEAAKQLQSFENKIIIVVIDILSENFLSMPINDKYIDWDSPEFFISEASNAWHSFLIKQKEKYTDLHNDITHCFNSINQLWILAQDRGFQYSRVFKKEFAK